SKRCAVSGHYVICSIIPRDRVMRRRNTRRIERNSRQGCCFTGNATDSCVAIDAPRTMRERQEPADDEEILRKRRAIGSLTKSQDDNGSQRQPCRLNLLTFP